MCKKFSKKGHFAKCCYKRDTHEIEQNSSEESDVCHDSDSSSSSFFFGLVESKQVDVKPDSNNGSDTPCDPNNVYTCDDTQNSEWKISLQSNGSDVEYKIDTGAQVNVLPYKQYLRLQKKPKLHKRVFSYQHITAPRYQSRDVVFFMLYINQKRSLLCSLLQILMQHQF